MTPHPVAVIGEVTAGAAVVASAPYWSFSPATMHEWVGTVAAAMAITYYLIMLIRWLMSRP